MKSCQSLVTPLRTADPNQPCGSRKNPNNTKRQQAGPDPTYIDHVQLIFYNLHLDAYSLHTFDLKAEACPCLLLKGHFSAVAYQCRGGEA